MTRPNIPSLSASRTVAGVDGKQIEYGNCVNIDEMVEFVAIEGMDALKTELIMSKVAEYGLVNVFLGRAEIQMNVAIGDRRRTEFENKTEEHKQRSKALFDMIKRMVEGHSEPVPEGYCQLASDEENGLLPWSPRDGVCTCCGGEWIQGNHFDKEEADKYRHGISKEEQRMMDEYAEESYRNCPSCLKPMVFAKEVVDGSLLIMARCETCKLEYEKDNYGLIEHIPAGMRALIANDDECPNCWSKDVHTLCGKNGHCATRCNQCKYQYGWKKGAEGRVLLSATHKGQAYVHAK